MTKQAMFTMKLESELHAAFMADAAASHRSAAQVVRELMREYVAKQQDERAYKTFLEDKVERARSSLAAGHDLLSEDVESQMAEARKRYTLDTLSSELPPKFELSDEQKAWEQLRPVGNEI